VSRCRSHIAALNVMSVAPEFEPPRSHSENPARDECAGFFIAIGLAVPAGLLVWAAVIAALILK
jgi:hypothetical protein